MGTLSAYKKSNPTYMRQSQTLIPEKKAQLLFAQKIKSYLLETKLESSVYKKSRRISRISPAIGKVKAELLDVCNQKTNHYISNKQNIL